MAWDFCCESILFLNLFYSKNIIKYDTNILTSIIFYGSFTCIHTQLLFPFIIDLLTHLRVLFRICISETIKNTDPLHRKEWSSKMQRNWIITNNAKAEVYAFLIRHHVSFEPSACYDRHTCIATWNLSSQQAILIENFIISHKYGYCMDKKPIPINC